MSEPEVIGTGNLEVTEYLRAEVERLKALNLQQLRINGDLREQVERDRPVVNAAVEWVRSDMETSTYLERCRATYEIRHAVRERRSSAPDEVNEATP